MDLKTILISEMKFSLMGLTANLYRRGIANLKTGQKDLSLLKYTVKELSDKNGIVYVKQYQ